MSRREAVELLPCPFCGAAAGVTEAVGEAWASCYGCNASGPMKATRAEAVAAWNRRALAALEREGAGGLTHDQRVALWDAINEYVETCGGNPSRHVYGNTPRQRAVAKVEAVFRPTPPASEATAARPEEQNYPRCSQIGCGRRSTYVIDGPIYVCDEHEGRFVVGGTGALHE